MTVAFPLIEAAILDTPLLSSHQQYVSFCADHPNESLSEETFRTYANEIDGVTLVKRFQQVVKPVTERLDMSRYLNEVLEYDRLSHAKKKEIGEIVPDSDEESGSSLAETGTLSHPPIHKKLLAVFLVACNVSQEVLAPFRGRFFRFRVAEDDKFPSWEGQGGLSGVGFLRRSRRIPLLGGDFRLPFRER